MEAQATACAKGGSANATACL